MLRIFLKNALQSILFHSFRENFKFKTSFTSLNKMSETHEIAVSQTNFTITAQFLIVYFQKILQLPNEILREILSYVPNQLVVGEICTRFYEISCTLKSYQLILKIPRLQRVPNATFIDDEVCRSIIRSDRKIESIKIFFDHSRTITDHAWHNLMSVIDVIGENIREMTIRANELSWRELRMLKLMPNLHKLVIFKKYEPTFTHKISRNFCLRLHNLRELQVDFDTDILDIFEHLPDNSLRKLRLDVGSGEKIFSKTNKTLKKSLQVH